MAFGPATTKKIANKKLTEKRKSIEVLSINLAKELEEKNSAYEMSKLQNEMELKKSMTEIETREKEEMIKYEGVKGKMAGDAWKIFKMEAFLNNAEFYFGDSIPKYFNDKSNAKLNDSLLDGN